jgi:hypothetical protein
MSVSHISKKPLALSDALILIWSRLQMLWTDPTLSVASGTYSGKTSGASLRTCAGMHIINS